MEPRWLLCGTWRNASAQRSECLSFNSVWRWVPWPQGEPHSPFHSWLRCLELPPSSSLICPSHTWSDTTLCEPHTLPPTHDWDVSSWSNPASQSIWPGLNQDQPGAKLKPGARSKETNPRAITFNQTMQIPYVLLVCWPTSVGALDFEYACSNFWLKDVQ